MEGGIDLESPVILNGNEVPGSYHVEAGTVEVPASQFSYSVGPFVAPVMVEEQGVGPVESELPAMAVGPVVSAPQAMAVEQGIVAMQVVNGVAPGTEMKKKRGRPRKYGPDGKPLSPMPISASIPLSGETWKPSKGVSVDLFKKKKKKQKLEFGSPGSQVPYSVGANFTPHMITVNSGEDVSMKIISFSQQGSRVICILSAIGSVSNVTLHQPSSSGGTLTYEGHFEILSLSGSFMAMPTDSGGTKSRAGGMSVSLAGPDGRVLGGGLAGMLIAAGPVQVVIGSFLPSHQQEHKPKKQKSEVAAAFLPFPTNHNSERGTEMIYNAPQQSLAPVPYYGNNLSFENPVQGSTILGVTNNLSLSGGPKDLSQTKFMVSC